jgi:dethiobiotin synthetase
LPPHASPFTPHREAPPRGVFVTGTDTGVGKTLAACALLRAFAARGLKAAGMKPVAAGAERVAGAWRNEDVIALRAASNVDAPEEEVNPYCFAPPIAPHIAAHEAQAAISAQRIADACARLAQRAEVVVVEGAGGLLVPLGAELDMAALAQRLALPLVLVVGMRLGCLNHALLTAVAARCRGLALAGWIANHVDPDMPRADENVATLRAALDAPLLARIPHGADVDAAAAALDVGTLLAWHRRSRPAAN